MISLSEYIINIIKLFSLNEQAPKGDWITLDNGRHVLINPDTGEILSGTLKGTDMKDYDKNIEDKSSDSNDEPEHVHKDVNFNDILSNKRQQVQKEFSELVKKVEEIIEKSKSSSSLPKELQKHITTTEKFKRVKKLLTNEKVKEFHALTFRREELQSESEKLENKKKLTKEEKKRKEEIDKELGQLEDAYWSDENFQARQDYDEAVGYLQMYLTSNELKENNIPSYTDEEIDIIFDNDFETHTPPTKQQRKDITTYTGNDYKLINGYLSKGVEALKGKNWNSSYEFKGFQRRLKTKEGMEQCIANLDTAISASKLKHDTTVMRGISDFEVQKLLGSGIYENERFLSTSPDFRTADKFGTGDEENKNILIINLPKGYSALPVRNLSEFSWENEIMLPRNCKFKLKKKTSGNNGATFYVVEPVIE